MQSRSTDHVVIAGGTGLIGRALARHWLAAGRDVVVLTRQTKPALPPGARAVVWGTSHDGGWRAAIEGAHAVVNLCGESIGARRWTAARKRTLIESRTRPTRALADVIRRTAHPPAVFVQASGVGYYGTGDAICTESSPRGADFLAHLATEWERAASAVPASVRLVIARLGVVLDAGGGAFPRLAMPARFGLGGPIAGGAQWFSWVHIEDAVAALAFAVDESTLAGPVNVTSPHPLRNAEVARTLGSTLRRPALLPLPRLALGLLLGEQATLVCDGQRALPTKLQSAGFAFRYPTFAEAAGELLGARAAA
jgi:hypothetical protein